MSLRILSEKENHGSYPKMKFAIGYQLAEEGENFRKVCLEELAVFLTGLTFHCRI